MAKICQTNWLPTLRRVWFYPLEVPRKTRICVWHDQRRTQISHASLSDNSGSQPLNQAVVDNFFVKAQHYRNFWQRYEIAAFKEPDYIKSDSFVEFSKRFLKRFWTSATHLLEFLFRLGYKPFEFTVHGITPLIQGANVNNRNLYFTKMQRGKVELPRSIRTNT